MQLPAPWIPELSSNSDVSHFQHDDVDTGDGGDDDAGAMAAPIDDGVSTDSSESDTEYDFRWCVGF